MPKSTHVNTANAKSFTQRYQFWLTLVVAFIVLQLPLISIPFKWLESYFHEISHGMAALISGGDIVRIQLFPNGAGLCTTRGGSAFLISFMGYAGAIIWGSLIYLLATAHRKITTIFSLLLIVLLSISIIFWVRDLLTLFIVLVLLAVILVQLRFLSRRYFQELLKVTGLLVLLNSIQSPLYLLDGRAMGDGSALAQITFIPEFIWVGIWFTLALFTALKLSKLSR